MLDYLVLFKNVFILLFCFSSYMFVYLSFFFVFLLYEIPVIPNEVPNIIYTNILDS